MLRRYSRAVAAIVLCFFTWTSGGVFSVAHAAVDGVKKAKAQEQQGKRNDGPQERFSQLTEELAEVLANSTATADEKKQRLITAKVEIQGLDTEIRKEFAATEQKLRDAKLPAEILERHYRFVKHYDDNLAEFKGNVERVEKAKTKIETEAQVQEALNHLEKVKAPSKHQPLDPNKLPFDQRKPQKREPRMKTEEFERDLKKDKNAWKQEKRIVVASAGSMAGLLGPDELAETIEVQLTPEIRAKALELGNSPHRIYEWVRNNIEFVPTWGSIQGAQMTLQTRQGNGFDTASLLVALLRAAGVPSRYVTGTIELPIEKVMNWGGGFTDPMAALDFFSSGGVPTKGLVAGGKVVAARMEHVWVEAFVDYIPSRGAKHKQGEGDTWVKLDAAFKQYNRISGIDLKTAVPFDAQNLLTQMQSGATMSETQGYITGINSSVVQQILQDYQARVEDYLQQSVLNPTIGDIVGRTEIIKQEQPYLLGTLPYRTAVKGATFTTIPESLRHKLSFHVANEATNQSFVDPDAPQAADTSLRMTKSLPELAGKKITLSYAPATVQDETVVNAYLPRPHADGTPIQPSELPSSLPAYLVNLKPELRVDGVVVATGAPVGLGGTNIFSMTFSDPTYGSSGFTNYVDAGVYQAIALNLGEISTEQLAGLKDQFDTTRIKLQNQDYAGVTKNELIGDPLFATALTYHAELSAFNRIYARSLNVSALTLPSETVFSTKMRVMTLWGIPRYVNPAGLNMDADYLMQVVKAKDGDSEAARKYMLTSGMTSSALEHAVPEQLFSTPQMPAQGISTAKALAIANDSRIPIYNITSANIAAVLPQLQIAKQVKDEIVNAVNAGKAVTVSKSSISYNGWIGCGYIITDTETGAGAYMISSGSSGSDTKVDKTYWSQFDTLFTILDIKNSIIGQLITSKAFEAIAKSMGIFGTLIQALMDFKTIYDMDSPDKVKKMSSYLLITSCSAISIIAGFLALGVAGGPLFVVTATALTMITITFVMNFIKTLALEAIWSARLNRRNRTEKEVMLA